MSACRFGRVLATLASSLLIAVATAGAQAAHETIALVDGSTVTGELISVDDQSLTMSRRVGSGTAKQILPFDRIDPEALYGIIYRTLTPLEGADHLRMAEVASKAGLYGAAARHFDEYAKFVGGATPDLEAKIKDAQAKDIAVLMERSRTELGHELFGTARKLALETMRRYPAHPAIEPIPTYLEEVTAAAMEAQRRDAALASTRRAKAEWERGERALTEVDRWLRKAKEAEQAALSDSSRVQNVKDQVDNGLKFLRNAVAATKDLRQSRLLPSGLRGNLAKMDEEVITMQIRLRLHLASSYTVRGSYGTALTYVNQALAYDPTDAQALAARARIEEAAASASRRDYYGRVR
jgi:hypothetical protein